MNFLELGRSTQARARRCSGRVAAAIDTVPAGLVCNIAMRDACTSACITYTVSDTETADGLMFVRARIRKVCRQYRGYVHVCTSPHLAIASVAHQPFWPTLLHVRVYGWTNSGTSGSTGSCTGSLAEGVVVLPSAFSSCCGQVFEERPFK